MFVFHIGLHKTGTTTLQTLLARNVSELEARGIIYPALDQQGAHHVLSKAMAQPENAYATVWEKLRALQSRARTSTVVLSSETFWRAEPRLVKQATEGREARIIVYVRDLPSWAVSVYSQWAKVGRCTTSFDEYFSDLLSQRNEFLAACLLRWARVFGAAQVRVRSIEPEVLTGGDLIDDFLAALGTTREGLVMPHNLNTTPDWRVVELIKSRQELAAGRRIWDPWWVGAANGQTRWYETAVAQQIRVAGVSAGKRLGWADRAEYLTHDQRRLLLEWYHADCGRLVEALPDCQIHEAALDVDRQRPFLPAVEAISAADRDAFEAEFLRLGDSFGSRR